MSKYPVMYVSKSKGTEIALEEMHSSHLTNSYKKAWREVAQDSATDDNSPEAAHRATLMGAMAEELRSRGAYVAGGTVTWPESDPAGERTE